MADYEINDVRNRRSSKSVPVVTFEVEIYAELIVVFDIANIGSVIVGDVQFDFSIQLPWKPHMPSALKNGISHMLPRQKLRFWYHSFPDILKEGSAIPALFSVNISYKHPDFATRQSFDWPVDLASHRDSTNIRSYSDVQTGRIIEEIKKLNGNLEQLRNILAPVKSLGGATGLDLSIGTLRNLERLRQGRDVEPLPVPALPL